MNQEVKLPDSTFVPDGARVDKGQTPDGYEFILFQFEGRILGLPQDQEKKMALIAMDIEFAEKIVEELKSTFGIGVKSE